MNNDNRSENEGRANSSWLWLNRRADLQLLIVLSLIVFALFCNSLNNRFAYDDHVLIESNTSLREWSYFTTAFTDSHSYDVSWVNLKNSALDYYRPFTRMLFALAFQAFGLETFYWHLLSVLIFIGVVTLAYAVVKELTRSRALAFLATLLFAVHPIHSEAVAWVNCLVETLHALFFLGAFALYLKARNEGILGKGRIFFFGSLALAAGGLLSKETSLAIPILVAAYNFIFTEENLFQRIKAAIVSAIPYLFVVLCYFILRYFAYGGSLRIVSRVPMSTVILTIPSVILEYFTMLILPLKLSSVHSVPYVTSFTSLRFWLPAILLTALAAAIWLYTSRQFTFICCWILITLLPVLNIGIFTPDLLLQDRYAFLPSLGFCAVVAMAIAKFFETDGALARGRAVVAALLVIAVVGLAALTLRQNKFWYNDRTIFGRATAMNPNSEFARCNYGFALYNENAVDEAARQFSEAIKIKKQQTGLESGCGCQGLGGYYADKKDYPQAIVFLERARELGEGEFNLLIFNQLAYAYDQVGEGKKAEALLKDLLDQHPDFQEAHFTLSQILIKANKYDQGMLELDRAIQLNPQDANARLLLGQILENRGLRKEAAEQYRIVLNISPNTELARTRLSAIENGGKK